LSPAYDVNPSVERDDLTLAINETETACDVAIAREAHRLYGLTLREADGVIDEVGSAVRGWRVIAGELRISRSEMEMMAGAFGTG
jgi:serine/threonine-protein kinase HipA